MNFSDKRATLIKSKVGCGRQSTHSLPPTDFVYGSKYKKSESTADIFSNWSQVKNVKAHRKSSNVSNSDNGVYINIVCGVSSPPPEPMRQIMNTDYTSYENHDVFYPKIPPPRKIIPFPPTKATGMIYNLLSLYNTLLRICTLTYTRILLLLCIYAVASLLAKKAREKKDEVMYTKELFKMSKFKRIPSKLALNGSCHRSSIHSNSSTLATTQSITSEYNNSNNKRLSSSNSNNGNNTHSPRTTPSKTGQSITPRPSPKLSNLSKLSTIHLTAAQSPRLTKHLKSTVAASDTNRTSSTVTSTNPTTTASYTATVSPVASRISTANSYDSRRSWH